MKHKGSLENSKAKSNSSRLRRTSQQLKELVCWRHQRGNMKHAHAIEFDWVSILANFFLKGNWLNLMPLMQHHSLFRN